MLPDLCARDYGSGELVILGTFCDHIWVDKRQCVFINYYLLFSLHHHHLHPSSLSLSLVYSQVVPKTSLSPGHFPQKSWSSQASWETQCFLVYTWKSFLA